MNMKYHPDQVAYGLALADYESGLRLAGLGATTALNYRNHVGRAIRALVGDGGVEWTERVQDADALRSYGETLSTSSYVVFSAAWGRFVRAWPTAAPLPSLVPESTVQRHQHPEPVTPEVTALWRVLAATLTPQDIGALTMRCVRSGTTQPDGSITFTVVSPPSGKRINTLSVRVSRDVLAPVIKRALREGEEWPAADRPLVGRVPSGDAPYGVQIIRGHTVGILRRF